MNEPGKIHADFGSLNSCASVGARQYTAANVGGTASASRTGSLPAIAKATARADSGAMR